MIKKSPHQKINKYANLRKQEVREIKSFIVIVVEGAKTERLYFEMLQKNFRDKVKLKVVIPEKGKSSPAKLLDALRNQKAKYISAENSKNPDSFWMICDVDLHKGIHQVITDALRENFKIAVSNPCFEVWLFLHLGNIKIKNDSTSLLSLEGKLLLEIKKVKKIDRKLSQKIAKTLDQVRNKPHDGYEKVYLDSLKEAILRSSKNLKKIKENDFLIGAKYIGQTRVGELISKIIK